MLQTLNGINIADKKLPMDHTPRDTQLQVLRRNLRNFARKTITHAAFSKISLILIYLENLKGRRGTIMVPTLKKVTG